MSTKDIYSFRLDNSIVYYSSITTVLGNFFLLLDYTGKLIRISSYDIFDELFSSSNAKAKSLIYPAIMSVMYRVDKQLNLYLEGIISEFSISYKVTLDPLYADVLACISKHTKYSKLYNLEDIYLLMKNKAKEADIHEAIIKNPLPILIPTHRIVNLEKEEELIHLEEYLLYVEAGDTQKVLAY